MTQGPAVSVVVTTKNSARTLEACLRSVRAQTYPAAELIVIDNFSTDASARIASVYADRVIERGPERCAQRNAGIALARGEYVFIIDSDMVLNQRVVESCVQRAADRDAVAIDEVSFGTGFWARCKTLERSFYHGDPIVSAARFFRRSAIVAVGGYDESLVGGDDWDLSLRVAGAQPLTFASDSILHDEGALRLRDLFLKKVYYGRTLPRFIRKHGRNALLRVNPVRGSLVGNCVRALRSPLLAGGVVVMKVTEFTGVMLGVLLSRQPSQRSASAR